MTNSGQEDGRKDPWVANLVKSLADTMEHHRRALQREVESAAAVLQDPEMAEEWTSRKMDPEAMSLLFELSLELSPKLAGAAFNLRGVELVFRGQTVQLKPALDALSSLKILP